MIRHGLTFCIDRDKIWNLSKKPYDLTHDFCYVGNGDKKLHYVRSVPPSGITGETSLVIFMHGFPDSWHLWKHYLVNAQIASKAVLIAVDLPGHGGSDSLERYGPNEVLSLLSDFILRMREQYLAPPGKRAAGKKAPRVLIVAHDWGALLAFRLAAEAPELADRFILSNAAHPPVIIANIKGRLETAKRMLRAWMQSPRNYRLLAKSYANVKPILAQLVKSGYVFTFRLPPPFTPVLGSLGDFWFFRLLNAVACGDNDPSVPARTPLGYGLLASTAGPGPAECETEVAAADADASTSEDGSSAAWKYSEGVRRRSATAGWLDKTALYRDGCFAAKWDKPLELLVALAADRRRASSAVAIAKLGPDGALLAPVSLLWGAADLAVENALALDGFVDYFTRASHIVKITGCGHWAPVDPVGEPVFDAVLNWALDGEKQPLRAALAADYPMAVIATEK